MVNDTGRGEPGMCCLLFAESHSLAHDIDGTDRLYLALLQDGAPLPAFDRYTRDGALIRYNDETSTAELLERLDRIGADE